MAETNFRATFTADDQSFSSVLRKMKDESSAMANEMIADANKIAQATDQNVNKVLKEQIALYERGRKLTMSQERMALDASWASKMASASPSNQSGIKAQWNEARKDLSEQFKRDDMQIELLRSIVDSLNDSSMRGVGSKEAKENIAKLRSGGKLSTEEEYKARVQASAVAVDKDKASGIMDMWNVAKGTMLGQMIMGAGGKIGGMVSGVVSASDGEMAASKFWSAIPMVGDALANASGRHIELAEKRDRLAYGINSRGGNVGILQDERNIVRTAGGMITQEQFEANKKFVKDWEDIFVGAAGEEKEGRAKSGYIREKMDKKLAKLKASKAEADIERASAQERSVMGWSYQAAGIDTTEFLEMAGKLLPEIGSSSNLLGQTKSFADITRGGGIGEGTALGVAGLLRQSGGGDLRKVMGNIVGDLAQGGTTRALRDRHVADVVTMSNARYGEGFADVDPVRMAKVKSAFKANYGEALSSADNIMGMMSAVAKPADEFQQGINYKIYSEQMAKEGREASYVGFQKWQEKPENGLLAGKMDYIKSVYGEGEFGVMAMQGAGLGKTWEANEVFLKGGTKGLDQATLAAKSKTVGFDAKDYASDRQIQQAKMTDAFTKSMKEGIEESFKQVGKSISEAISAAPFPAADILKQWILSITGN